MKTWTGSIGMSNTINAHAKWAAVWFARRNSSKSARAAARMAINNLRKAAGR